MRHLKDDLTASLIVMAVLGAVTAVMLLLQAHQVVHSFDLVRDTNAIRRAASLVRRDLESRHPSLGGGRGLVLVCLRSNLSALNKLVARTAVARILCGARMSLTR